MSYFNFYNVYDVPLEKQKVEDWKQSFVKLPAHWIWADKLSGKT